MKNSTLVALGALGVGAYLLSRRKAPGGGAGGLDGAFPPGSFKPEDASKQEDFARVVGDIEDYEQDWMLWCAAPGYDQSRYRATSPLDLAAYYKRQLWEPASRMSVNDLNKGDFDRMAYFMSGAWKQGPAVGCDLTIPDKVFKEVSEHLEDIASGLDIGASIGTGLASIFGYGKLAEASDKSFGFGRGASETREAQISYETLPASFRVDLAALDNAAKVRPDPNGDPQGANTLWMNDGTSVVASMGNIFNAAWEKWAEGYAPVDENDLYAPDARGKVVSAQGSIGDTGVALFVHVGGTLDPDNRNEIEGGQVWLRRAWNMPWMSREMGCALSLREKVYIRARMYRTIDLIRSILLPTESVVTAVDSGLAGYTIDPETGGKVFDNASLLSDAHEYSGVYITRSYVSERFGKVGGSIFPPLPGDHVESPAQTNDAANYIPFGGTDLPTEVPRTPEQNRIDVLSATPVVSMPAQTAVPQQPAPESTAGAPSSPSGPVNTVSRFSRFRG